MADHPSITIAILFGSVAADRARMDSDLDLAVASTIPLSPEMRIQLIEELLNPYLAQHMTKAVGFRNIAVHSYQAIDWNITFYICHQHLDDFKQFAQAVTHRLHSH